MANLAPYFLNADHVLHSTDGVTANADSFGDLMTEGTSLGDPDTATDGMMDGRSLAAGSKQAMTIRVLLGDTTVFATILAAVSSGVDQYFHFQNRAGTKTFVLGPAKVTEARERAPTGTEQRGAYVIAFNVAGDLPSDFVVNETTT